MSLCFCAKTLLNAKVATFVRSFSQGLGLLLLTSVLLTCGEDDQLKELEISVTPDRPQLWEVDSFRPLPPQENAPEAPREREEVPRNWYAILVNFRNAGTEPIVVQGIRWTQTFFVGGVQQEEEGGVTQRFGAVVDSPVFLELQPASAGDASAAQEAIYISGLPEDLSSPVVRGEFIVVGWVGTIDVQRRPFEKRFRVTTSAD